MNLAKIILPCAALLLCACGKWLDVTSKSEVDIDDMFSSAEGYYNSATGIYNGMGSSYLYGGYVSLTALEPLTGQYTISGNNENRRKWAAYDYASDGSKDIIDNIWLTMYNNIFNANLVIDKLRDETLSFFDEGVRETMLGEMIALRAYMYFDLFRMFNEAYAVNPASNNVPWKTTWDATIGERLTSQRLLAQLMTELAEAKLLLKGYDPILTGRSSADPYVSYNRTKRMNYYAVCALRARIALHTGDWATAYDEAQEVIRSEKFRFITAPEIVQTDTYGEELKSNRVFTPELVFALDNDQITTSARSYYEGLSEDMVASRNCYEASDLRRNAWLADNSMNRINMIKYKRSALAADSYKYPKACTPMLKLSEMYLIAEEAVMNDPQLDPGRLSFINTLKQHREVSTLGEGTSDEALRTALTREYICDFKGEGQLFFYYKRLDLERIDNGNYNGNTVAINRAVYTFPRPDNENDFGN